MYNGKTKLDNSSVISSYASKQMTDNQKLAIVKLDTPKKFGWDKPFEKIQHMVNEDIQGAVNSDIKRSFTRGYAHRALFNLALLPLGHCKNFGEYVDYLRETAIPWETSYQMVNRFIDSRGGKLFPQFSAKYENGENNDKIGSIGHMAAKSFDVTLAGFVSPILASSIFPFFHEAFKRNDKKDLSQSFLNRVYKKFFTGGDYFNKGDKFGGQFNDERAFVTLNGIGFNSMDEIGLQGSWRGALGAAAIGSTAYVATKDIFNKENRKASEVIYDITRRSVNRMGIFPNVYSLPLPFGIDLAKKKKDTEYIVPLSKQDQKLQARQDRVEAVADIAYGLSAVVTTLGIPYYLSSKYRK